MLRAQNPTPVCARYEYVRESAVTRTRKAGEVTKPVEAARAGGLVSPVEPHEGSVA
ncbi:predicted protein [Streptomyces lividans TK24]|uniref:Uncharacterized protein n=1 Tax=Streptomyces lividans 1326 TaxID=1200984 RepID=A0A7U9HAC0_STRLI|nr:predicted protein [Streptomyces lividans TK24]EOY47155.1 hypothetical protein SLI_2440 [Streptomyces lividans 1326]